MLFSGWKDYSWETISTDVQSGEGRTNNQDTCLNSIIDNYNTGWDCKDDLKLNCLTVSNSGILWENSILS